VIPSAEHAAEEQWGQAARSN